MKIFKVLNIITTVLHWCKLFKSKRLIEELPEPSMPANPEQGNITNVSPETGIAMQKVMLNLVSPRFKRVVREKVIPILQVVAAETKNQIDDAAVHLLEELFKPETLPGPGDGNEN